MSRSVLLCDDEVHILRAAEFKLKRAGLDVRCACDGQEAWEMMQADCPDVLVTDYQMPRMDGMQLAELVHTTPATSHVPVLMLTAKGFELSSEELYTKCGVKAIVCKPFSPRKLLEQVESILQEREAVACGEGP